jgi:Sulfotransferase family
MTTVDESTRPIFVVGAVRSGTTLVRYMLCSHPRIYLTPESNFIPRFFGSRPTGELSAATADRIFAGIAEYKPFWRDWEGAPPDWRDVVKPNTTLTAGSLLSGLYGAYAQQYGAPRWGDKTPGYVAHLELLSRIFPRCQFIHVMRDARDAVTSQLETYRGRRFFYMDPYYAARTWNEQLRAGMRFGRSLPRGRYHEVRYEDVTSTPEPVLRQLCAFLDEDYDANMASPYLEARRHHHSQGIHRSVRKPVSTGSVGRWRRDLAAEDQRVVQPLVSALLRELGYPVEDVGRPAPSERLRAASLHTKYVVVDTARRTLASAGVGNPTRLLRPMAKRSPGAAAPAGEAKVYA